MIKDRIDSGEIDPTGEQLRPRGIRNVSSDESREHALVATPPDDGTEPATGAAALFVRTDGTRSEADPAPVARPSLFEPSPAAPTRSVAEPSAPTPPATVEPTPAAPTLLPGVMLDAKELCSMSGLTAGQLAELISYGVLASDSVSGASTYNDDALAIATNAKRFLDAGVDARHLRGWRVAAEREAGLLDQLVQPLLRQRNPEARAQAIQQLIELEAVGGRLRSAMMREALRSHMH